MQPVDAGWTAAKFDLSLVVEEAGGRLRAVLDYDADLFEAATARRLLQRFLAVLESAVSEPAARLSALALVSDAERHQLLAEWNDTGVTVQAGPLLAERIGEQARRAPEALAVAAGDRQLTYGELDRCAGRLARRLLRLGVGPESRVAVCLPRSPEQVVALLAVWKAGGAYVPLDPAHPAERLAAVLEDAGAPVLIARQPLAAELAGSGIHALDPEAEEPAAGPDAAAIPASAGSLAYVIYTSGSTGRPKGVEVEHRSLLNLVAWHQAAYRLTAADRTTLLARVGFDASVWELWPTLAAGASLHVVEDETLADPHALRDRLVDAGITVCFAPTPLAELLLEVQWPTGTALRTLLTGGDMLRRRPPAGLPFALVNHYGPTEATVVSTAAPVPAAGADLPAIGRPIANLQAYVVGPELRPVAPGVPGELCVGGAGLARGYLRGPAATAERFVPDPFGGEPGARLYRTGDLVRRLPDGELHFLGRIDRQVKLRGFRIELGEIEAALARHPAVREAAVILAGGGSPRLVAFVTLWREPAPPADEVLAALRRSLPDYMVPALLVPLPKMPLSTNGKLDRRALARLIPDEGGPAAGGALLSPAEKLIAQIWGEVLGPRALEPHDDFFQLGGHSMLAARVLARIRETLGVELPLARLFAAPTVAGLAAAVDAVRSGRAPVARLPIRPVPRGGLLPASYAQEGLWFIDRLSPGGPVYNLPFGWRLSGPLRPAALAAAFCELSLRHEVLRSRFVEVDRRPFVEVSPAAAALPSIDLSGLGEPRAVAELARLFREEVRSGFDLGRGPLCRFRLTLLGPGEHALLATFHHAVFDGWSEGILKRELAELYEAALAGRRPLLPDLPVQYADFAAWQQSWLAGEGLAPQLAYWRRELAGAPQALELPTDRPHPPAPRFRGGIEQLAMPADLAAAVRALGRRDGLTPFMIFLAGFQTLLHRLTGQEDVLVGAPAADRPRPEVEGAIGYFVNVIVLRARFGRQGATVRDLLVRVRDTALDAYANQDLPFRQLVAELHVERDLSRNPFFQAMLAFHPPAEPFVLRGLTAAPLAFDELPAKFDLSLAVSEPTGGFDCLLEYDADLFDQATAERLLARYTTLLAAMVAAPERRLDEIPLLAEAEVRELVAAAAGSVGPPREPRRLADLFAAQAARTPEAVAVLGPAGERLSYTELDGLSDRLAAALELRGVGPEVPVGACLERSPELVVALLGVLKAGGVWLPLDPSYPQDRLAFMLEDSGAPLALTVERTSAVLPAGPWDAVPLDAPDGPLVAAGGAHEQERHHQRLTESLAWLVYTSGSTGRPKGVGVSHAAAAAFVEAAAGLFELRPSDRVLQFSSPSFDMSLKELLTPLVAGAAVALRGAVLPAPAALLDLTATLGVTVLSLPAAYWHQWAVELDGARMPPGLSLRLVILGGEAMSGEAARRWLRSPLAGVRLLNGYGPTETTVTATAQELDLAAAAAGTVPIGRALPGRSAWVLDAYGQPVPDGVVGELHIGGPLLARGYLGRPAATAERFVPDLFAGEPGARLYRTGDRVRRRPDGTLDFLGRVDRQLKVRGFRVEPGEVEAALARHPAVRQAVVDGREDGAGGLRLVAWIVPAAEAPSSAELRDLLRDVLPEHMVPSAFVSLPALPLTANGKVDSRALPAPEAAGDDLAGGAPRTPAEELLAGLWSEVLKVGRVGRADHFFALGGHSLLAIRLLARVRDAFGIEVPLAELFASPTLEGLAAAIDEALSETERRRRGPRRAVAAPVALPPEPGRLHDLVAAQAERQPDATAVLTGSGARLSYAELDRRSDRLARALERHGVRPETPVGACLDRSPELVVALLGVLKAGGVWLPLDPAYPPERLAFMLESSGARLALTLERLAASLPAGDWETVVLDAAAGPFAALDPGDEAPPAAAVPPESLAYLIYTSGSTGAPKGVGVSHAAAAAHMQVAAGLFELGPGDRFLQFSSPSFDMALEELLTPLVAGATVVLREGELWTPAELLERLAALGCSAVNLPTAYWHQWTAELDGAMPADPSLRLVVLGGEAMSGEAARRWLRSPLAGVRLLNAYGPTEATITATAQEVDAAAAAAGTVPIGGALPGRTIQVLDPEGRPVPDGVDGELCLGGPLLARGYLGRPAATAECFVPDPFAGEPGARLYRTGDRVRRRPDGALDFLGRVDRQLKVRGFRVEPGEVEAALARHPALRQVVVDGREDGGGGLRLVAWIVTAEEAPPSAELRDLLRETLPEHMVPSAFVSLPALPLTPNGKVDRRALPAPEAAGDLAGGAPRTPAEERLARLWAEVLKVERVGRADHFFALGGHSLLATHLLWRVRDAFGVEMPLAALFASPTLAGFAEAVEVALRRAAARRRAASPRSADERPPVGSDAAAEPLRAGEPPLVPVPRPAPLPLSFAQQRLWLVDRLQSAGSAYNIPTSLRLTGPLDRTALARSLAALVARHEVLRTRFVEVDGEPRQEVGDVAPAPPTPVFVDLASHPAAEREAERLVAEEVRRPFDLARGSLLRALLLRLGTADHLLVLTLHHAVTDGWSQGILLRELAALYNADAAELPALPIQYADFAVWQRRRADGAGLAAELDHWRERLAGTPVLELPADRPRPAAWTFRGAALSRPLPFELGAAFGRLGRRAGVTPYMALLAGVQTLLGRWAGQSDFALGSPSANRGRAETEGLIGFFVNMLVLRADLAGEPSFLDLLERVRDAVLTAHAHQDLPFERLVEELAPERDLGRNPLFQVTFQLLDRLEPPAFRELAAEPLELRTGTAKFDLSLYVTDGGAAGLVAGCDYATDLFEAATVARLLEHLAVLLAAAFAAPERRLADLEWLTAAEQHQLLCEWSDTTAEPLRVDAVHRLVARQARLRPEAPAVVSGGELLTYAELRRRASGMARRLRHLGAGPEVLVGISLDRSPELVVTLLAVLESGAAYLPLDPALPRERLDFLLADSGAAALVGRRALAGEAAATWEAERPCLWLDDEPAPELAGEPEEEPPATAADALAYVIYTSGSTGRPKGVEVGHRSLLNLVAWHLRAFGLTAADRATQLAQMAFDASVWEIWPALAAGAALHLPDEATRTAPELLRDWLVERQITVSFLPTPLAESVLALPWPGEARLRALLTGGDRLRQAPPAGLPFTLHNNYGPTEGTVVSTSGPVAPRGVDGAAAAVTPPSIGRPIDGVQALVLDAELAPVPVGVAGELWVGGASLARGYRGRPDLTAERFVPSPFAALAGLPGERLYRTGDLVRLAPDGRIDFLGRADDQVKVRGYRIEPGEIEAVLLDHPAVGEAVVVVREDARGEARLVAYVVPREPAAGGTALAAELRGLLAGRLPAYMVPSAFVTLEALPLTATGKVDRRALPAPDLAADDVTEAPRDQVEELVADLWKDVLGIERVGRDDDFFACGGHSLRATQLASRLKQAFDVDLPLKAVFEDPTVARLAARVRRLLGAEEAAAVPPIVRQPRPERIPLSFAQQRLWFLDRLEPERAVYNLPKAMALAGPLDAGALATALAALVARHESLRTRIVQIVQVVEVSEVGEAGGLPWQEIDPPGSVPLPLADLAALPAGRREAERDRLVEAEARRPFDLARGPLLRAALVHLGSKEHVLLLTTHHIVSDAWSEDLLARELSALYAAALAAGPERQDAAVLAAAAGLAPLAVQYPDVALWQRRFLESLLEEQLGYWRRELDGVATLELPTDRPRPPVPSFRGAGERLSLPPALVAALHDLARQCGATLFMTLLAAYQALLGRLAGQADVVVGSPVANRNRSEVEGLIGFFVNMLAFRGDLGGDPTFAELLTRVRHTALDAYGHQDLPFERLVDELAPERDMSRQPLAQVMIALQDAPPEPLALPGLEVAVLEPPLAIAKFDLTLYATLRNGGLEGVVEYATDLFDRSTVLRFAGHLTTMLSSMATRPEARLSEIDLVSAAERHQLLAEWNDTAEPFPGEVLMHQLFEAQADVAPGALAAVWNGEPLTYGGLEVRANRIADLLRGRGLSRGEPVGIWMERSLDMVAAVLGVLKAGGWYLPLDGAWPEDRVESILATTAAPAILTREAHLGRVLEMEWRLPALKDVVCLDVAAPQPSPEPVDVAGMRALFDLVAERAVDRATAGGFVSSFTGEPFSEAEVDEYRDRVIGLAWPWLREGARVLEIGSGSGLILWEAAPRVARYVGLDPSPLTQAKNREEAARRGLAQVELPVGFAHETTGWADGSFDLVIVASTAQFFPGPLYLERVVAEAMRLLTAGGALVIADVPDARRQGELARALAGHRECLDAAAPKQDPHKVLSLDEELFADLGAAVAGVGEVAVHHRESGFDNELRYRYDVVLTKLTEGSAPQAERRKSLWTSWHVERSSAARPAAVAAADDLAYVIHTSGSTGEPKGIAVQHRPVANLIHWLNREFGIGPADRVLFVTSLCFDLSVWDVFGLLAAGGTIHVASEQELREPERLVRALIEEPITVWDSAPAALVRLAPLFPARPAMPAISSRLRRVMLSGDWIPVTLPDRVRGAFPHAAVTSLGGATEATVWSNWYPIGEVDPRWPSIPYGRPIGNARYHVLDAGLAPCPVGVPGDLYIGGEVLCVGYAHQPATTAAAFVPDPFSGRSGARLYRTGDRARYVVDGNLEFLGRVDQQVKVRGFRIELGEIEVALARYPAVREAVVLAREDVPGDKRLVAYVVSKAGQTAPPAGELREFLRRSLPEYMVPSAFVVLDALPITANGKLDRKALPAPRWESVDDAATALPATPTEEALAVIWRQVLGVERVGRDDSFFELGGHSLLATQLVARLVEAFGVEVPLRTVFQSPSLSALAAVVDAALAGRASDPTAPAAAAPAIRPVPRDGGELPLSASQLRQWFLVQLEPESPGYNLPISLRLTGALQPEALTAALREIVRRHEALRTTFVAVGGRPVAVVSPAVALPLSAVDLSTMRPAAREPEAWRLVAEQLEVPFDLARGPLLSVLLVRLGPADHLLSVSIHHIVFDGWSLGVFLRELAALYEAFAAGLPSPLPELPIQYVDYAAWQQEWLASPALEAQVAHWKERLAGASRALELPTDRPRPAVRSHRGALLPLAVPPALAADLKDLAAASGTTLFMVLFAGYATLLSRVAGCDDLNVGTFVANRRREVLERLIGFFVNTIVLRADLSGDPSFGELLARTREATLEAFEHQETPFERLLDELEIGRDLSRTPLFQVMFGVQNFAMPTLESAGLTIRTESMLDHDRTYTDLGFWLWEAGDELSGWLQWSTELFDGATVQRMFGHMATLLAAAAADPDLPLSALPMMPEEERRQVLSEWSGGRAHRQAPRPVHERLRERALVAPEVPAVVASGRTLTYGELDRRADAVARGLGRLGLGAERVVGLAFDRSPETIAALFGILRAGAAYLPLDPALPAERLALLLADAGAPLVLTRSALSFSLPELPARVVTIEELASAAEDAALPPRPVPEPAPESAAYVLYTSGSTGAPKGVVVEHRSLAAFVEAAVELYGIGPRDRVLQFASLAFDTSVEEIYPCLAAGGTLVLRDEEMIASPERFVAACRQHGVTVLDLPTAYWHELSGWVEGGGTVPEDVRLVILGGERALPERVAGWLAAVGHGSQAPRLFNTYGPTEGTVVATACDLGEAAPAVPIGRPLPGVEVFVLDRELAPVPAGVPGEVWLGGAGLARGYLGRPDLTAERFVPSPFGAPGTRLYRTGDLGRWRSDGALYFAGRADDQVKIRGFRIEPGEVAAALARHPAVREAIVVARESGAGERRLAAYAVPAGEPWPAVAELRAFLRESLPAYMVPADLVLLDALPKTPTGKVDRRALPEPAGAAAPEPEGWAPPSTPVEELLAEIWRQLLGIERVGIYDDFFDLGGHSLLAPQLLSRIEELFGVALALRTLFEAPTVAQLATVIEQALLAEIEEMSDEEAAGLIGVEHQSGAAR